MALFKLSIQLHIWEIKLILGYFILSSPFSVAMFLIFQHWKVSPPWQIYRCGASILRGLVWFDHTGLYFLFFCVFRGQSCALPVCYCSPPPSVAFPLMALFFLYSVGPLKQFGFMVSSLKNLNGPNRLSLYPLNWCPCLWCQTLWVCCLSLCHHWPNPVGADLALCQATGVFQPHYQYSSYDPV